MATSTTSENPLPADADGASEPPSSSTSVGAGPSGVSATGAAAPVSQADRAYLALRELLVTLQIAPGEPLNEADLMRRLDVGRTPLREARNRLVIDRMVVTHSRRGTFATEVNLADLSLLTDLRVEVEGLAARRAATRATEADRKALGQLVAMPADAGDPHAAMRHDTAIHEAVWAAAHNHFLATVAARHHGLSTRIWYLFVDRMAHVAGHVDELAQQVELIVAGDAEAAGRHAREHVQRFEQAVRDVL